MNKYLSENGFSTESNFIAAIEKAKKERLINGEQAGLLRKVNTAANLAKHEWGPKFFSNMPQEVLDIIRENYELIE
ncbi:MAG: hypothetical protein H7A23_10100 [Leptospiraceae bacterium]|nr:hypothetical protein [Leptospiraceae bacterium]